MSSSSSTSMLSCRPAKRPRVVIGDDDIAVTPPQSLPDDLILEIAALADATTLLRWAATCKSLRRRILDPAYRRRLAARTAAAYYGGFDPALLVSFSYWLHNFTADTKSTHVVEIPPSPPRPRVSVHPSTTDLLADLEPLASRDGPLVLRHPTSRDLHGSVLCVFDALTGLVTLLPPVDVKVGSPPALLAVGGDRSFELLAADMRELKFQTLTFSFTYKYHHGWEPARTITGDHRRLRGVKPKGQPAVVGRTVHWLVAKSTTMHLISLDVDAAVAKREVEIPLATIYRDGTVKAIMTQHKPLSVEVAEGRLRLIVVGSRLGLLVMEDLEVSVWTMTASAWSRDMVIHTLEVMETQAGLRLPLQLPVMGFGERSGAMVLKTKDGELIRLDLGTKEATTMLEMTRKPGVDDELKRSQRWFGLGPVSLHEIDLESLLQASKTF